MKHRFVFWLIAALTLISPLRAEKFKVQETESIQKSLAISDHSKPVTVLIDNIFGSIDVKGTAANTIELRARKTIKARDQEKAGKAKEEVRLDITQDGNAFEFFVDGPFRDKDENRRNRDRWDPEYQVHYDFVLEVPARTDIVLKTVTDGDITVNAIEGQFDVRNVNGDVTLIAVAGYGAAHTVNGPVKVDFSRNPEQDCSFKTINGDVSLSFSGSLSADFWLKTFHGDALSDYEVTHLPPRAAEKIERGSRFSFKRDRFTGVRIGRGGPEISMDTLNGDLLIHKK